MKGRWIGFPSGEAARGWVPDGSMVVLDGSGEPGSRLDALRFAVEVTGFAVGRTGVRGCFWANSEPCSRLDKVIRYSVVWRPRETLEGSIRPFRSSRRRIFWTPRRDWLVFRARVSMLG